MIVKQFVSASDKESEKLFLRPHPDPEKYQQEFSYRQQIARKLRTQYAEGIYRHKCYTVTLKSRLSVTQGHWKRNHLIIHDLVVVELFDVEYYCDLENVGGLEVTEGH